MILQKFVSYWKNGVICAEFGKEFDTNTVEYPQHNSIIQKMHDEGVASKDLISCGCIQIHKDKVIMMSNRFFYRDDNDEDNLIESIVQLEKMR